MGLMSQIGKRSPGPKPGFDRDIVLDCLVELFWDNGYTSTSHEMMRAATGLSGSSLYNSFGDKRSIFDQVLERYHQRSVMLIQPLLDGSAGISDLLAWVEVLGDRVADPNAPGGCLMVATMGTLIGAEPDVRRRTGENLDRVRRAIMSTVERAVELDEIEPSRAAPLAASLTAAYVGILTVASGSDGPTVALDMVRGIEGLIRGSAGST